MRIKHKVNVRIAEDSNMKNIMFGPDDDLSEVVIDGYEKVCSGILGIDGGATESLSFGDVAAVKGIYIRVSGDAIVTINDGDPITLARSGEGATVTAKLFMEATITEVSIEAPEDVDISGVWCVWGDAAE